jgi:site-specific recombinase XerD
MQIALRREPTRVELGDPDNIFALVWRTKREMGKFNLMPKTVQHYLYSFDRILREHIKKNVTRYSTELTTRLVNNARNAYKNGKMCRTEYQNVRKVAALMNEFYETGGLVWRQLSPYGLRELPHEFSEPLIQFCENADREGILKASSIALLKSLVRRFIFSLIDVGIGSLKDITPQIISDRVTVFARKYPGGKSAMLFCLRTFLKFLYSNGVTTVDLSAAIPEMAPFRKPIREGFSRDDAHKMLTRPNVATSMGKRDYAIMMLASQTGLRACDIANLKRQDIHWRTNEIRIVQVKTGRALSMHLPVESGNAVVDYILHARPDCDIPDIFLCTNRPLRPIRNRSMSSLVTRYMRKAGLAESPVKRRGFHSFRRAFGKQLLEAETSLDVVNELLGHSNMDSSRPYIAIDETGLKKCALGLVVSRKERDNI